MQVTLAIVAIVAAALIVPWVVGKFTSAASRQVFRKTYATGKAAVLNGLSISAPVPPETVIAQIASVINAQDGAPTAIGRLYVKQRTTDLIQFALGSRVGGDSARALIRLEAAGSGCVGTFDVLHWHEDGAIVLGAETLTRLRTDVQIAVASLSGTAIVTGASGTLGVSGGADSTTSGWGASANSTLPRETALGSLVCPNMECRRWGYRTTTAVCETCGEVTVERG